MARVGASKKEKESGCYRSAPTQKRTKARHRKNLSLAIVSSPKPQSGR